MFSLEPSDEHQLLSETARQFAQEKLLPRLRDFEKSRSVAADARDAFSQIGLAGLEWSEEQGGAGLGALARCLVNEEVGAADPGAALALDAVGPALYALLECGDARAFETFAQPIARDPAARAVLICGNGAALEVNGQRVSGTVPWVPADRVDLLVHLDDAGATCIQGGIRCEPLRGAGLRAAGASELILDGAPVAARFDDAGGAERALARSQIYVTSLLLGVLRQASEFSRGYALERQAFGRPIAHHQGLAFLITDMFMAVEGARLLLHDAAWRVEQGLPCEAAAASAFVEAIEAGAFVGPNGVQILGGHGFMQDYPVEKFMREARALSTLCGGLDVARERAGAALAASTPPVTLSEGERA